MDTLTSIVTAAAVMTAMKIGVAGVMLAFLLRALFTPEDPHAPPRR